MKKAHNSGKMAYKKADGDTVGFLLFLNFCCAGVDRAEKVHILKITDKVVTKSLEIMHTRMQEKLTINEIARECYMNPDSFIRRFSRIVGISPHTYLKNIRLRTARYLKESGMSLSQIASEVGYSDASALSHALRHP